MSAPMPNMDRFLRHVDASGDCWEWTSARSHSGYGLFAPYGMNNRMAHRWFYEQMVGPVSPLLQLDHLCRNRLCVNPSHLEPVTARENLRRSPLGAGARARRTHCPRGHEYTPENVRLSARNQRNCRACNRQWDRDRGPRRWQQVLARRAEAA